MAEWTGATLIDLADIRVVMGSGTFANAATKLPTNGEENALARIRNDSSGVRVSAHVPAVSGSDKQNALVRLGTRQDYVAPVWGQVTLIPDEITLAGKGQIQLTAVLLHAVKLLRVRRILQARNQPQLGGDRMAVTLTLNELAVQLRYTTDASVSHQGTSTTLTWLTAWLAAATSWVERRAHH